MSHPETPNTGHLEFSKKLWLVASGALAGVVLYAAFGHVGWYAVLAIFALTGVFLIWQMRRHPKMQYVPLRAPRDAFPPVVRNVFERLPDPVLLVDTNGRALFANRAMREIVGTSIDHKHLSALLRMPSVLEAVDSTTRTGEPAHTTFAIRVPVERYFDAYTAHLGLEPSVVLLLLHDLTSLKRAEQMRADFVANASHELRTPLAAVTGFIETLKGPARDDPEARDSFLDIMLVESDRMKRLIDDLLSLSRIEMNEHVLPQTAVSLPELVAETIKSLQPLAEVDDITLTAEIEPGLPDVLGEHNELEQLLQNLAHNAVKYGREHGHVTISLRRAPAHGRGVRSMVAVAISDDGEGIPQDAIPRLTERFYRVDVKRSREKGGTGLGLAIVKHIVNRHGGKLQVESRVGQGSTFTAFLPACVEKMPNNASEDIS